MQRFARIFGTKHLQKKNFTLYYDEHNNAFKARVPDITFLSLLSSVPSIKRNRPPFCLECLAIYLFAIMELSLLSFLHRKQKAKDPCIPVYAFGGYAPVRILSSGCPIQRDCPDRRLIYNSVNTGLCLDCLDVLETLQTI